MNGILITFIVSLFGFETCVLLLFVREWRRERAAALAYREQRDEWQDKHITWAKCPECAMLVPCTGAISPCGICWLCETVIGESDLDPIHPAVEHANVRMDLGRIAADAFGRTAETHGLELHLPTVVTPCVPIAPGNAARYVSARAAKLAQEPTP